MPSDFTPSRCYEISLSKNYLKIELYDWSNFTLHIESKDNVYVTNLTLEVNHTVETKVSPEIVEIHTKNFSSWCRMFHVYASRPGISKIFLNIVNGTERHEEDNFHVDVDIVKIRALEIYGNWCRKYFYIFSVLSVYPQILMQFLRLSVVGLDMNYVCFNFISHLSYAVYTVFMYSQAGAYKETAQDDGLPVTIPENLVAIHGFIVAIVLSVQSIKYPAVDNKISTLGKELISFYGIVFTFGFLLAKFHIIKYVEFLYVCKYIYVAAMLTKYIPQLYKNYVIKSTFGWNIWNSLLEGTGAICLLTSIFINAYNYGTWLPVITNYMFWTVFVLLLQHVSFIVQHYFIYEKWTGLDLTEFQEITLQEKNELYRFYGKDEILITASGVLLLILLCSYSQLHETFDENQEV
ncbi:hypothetical protein NQ317_014962 [Molorchus minor]|uniref:Uncharacterized protein n=1 Tax=Molorchus minor TaxID=1323400 RepID=A0ABQ9JNL1_9CUCU|nr:hypothetical protein NQ317_014962 [Molorchus minor]